MKRTILSVIFFACFLMLMGCENNPTESGKDIKPTEISHITSTPSVVSEKGRIETEWFSDCDISFFCGNEQGTALKVYIPFVCSGQVSEVSLVEESFVLGDATVVKSECFQTDDADESNEHYIWYLSVDMTRPSFPCECNMISLLCNGEKTDYYFGRMYAVNYPDASPLDLESKLMSYHGVTVEMPEDPLKSINYDLQFMDDAELCISATSSDELVVDKEKNEKYFKRYRKNDSLEMWLTFETEKSKYRFFENYCICADKDGKRYLIPAYTQSRNRPIVVFLNKLQNK